MATYIHAEASSFFTDVSSGSLHRASAMLSAAAASADAASESSLGSGTETGCRAAGRGVRHGLMLGVGLFRFGWRGDVHGVYARRTLERAASPSASRPPELKAVAAQYSTSFFLSQDA